jgi:hypothetical protein
LRIEAGTFKTGSRSPENIWHVTNLSVVEVTVMW